METIDISDEELMAPGTNGFTVIDGGALIDALPGTTVQGKSFSEYFTKIFCPRIQDELKRVSRKDIVWDQYHSLTKEEAVHDSGYLVVPKSQQTGKSFCKILITRRNCFHFYTAQGSKIHNDKFVYVIVQTGDTVVVIILLSNFHHITAANPAAQIWISFKTSKSSLSIALPQA